MSYIRFTFKAHAKTQRGKDAKQENDETFFLQSKVVDGHIKYFATVVH